MVTTEQEAPGRATVLQRWLARLALVVAAATPSPSLDFVLSRLSSADHSNLAGKGLLRRARPNRAGVPVPAGRKVRMPGSTSFPSGHSASAFAFATAVGDELPLARLPLHALAAAITYSRVHTGAHYRVMCSSARSWELAPPSPSATPAAP